MSPEPLVSVIILNYKRLQELERCLESVVRQDWPNLEIIVVDNHSEEDVAGVVRKKSESIRLIELPANLGACGGRNAGIREARGEILISLDNDVSFETPNEVSKVVKAFATNPRFHVLALRICDVGTGALRVREWCHPRDWRRYSEQEFETTFFGEGASAFRREVFEVAGLYWEPLFIGVEGGELTLRMFSHGFRILYCPSIGVAHSMSREARPHDRPFHLYTRNYIWIGRKDYRLWQGIRFVVPNVLMMLYFSLRARRPLPFLRGLWEGFLRYPETAPRTPIDDAGLGRFRNLERTRPSLMRRFLRHRLEPQL
jgi:GT2 family glycosyltransferase